MRARRRGRRGREEKKGPHCGPRFSSHYNFREGRIQYFNNMHSYSQFVLLSWGYTDQPPDNYMEFVSVLNLIFHKP